MIYWEDVGIVQVCQQHEQAKNKWIIKSVSFQILMNWLFLIIKLPPKT